MAIMYPPRPKEFAEYSGEGMMFEALSRLPNDYYVFHSVSLISIRQDTIYESETDFVIYHEKKGLLFIEAKNGQVRYSDGCWWYGSGIPMAKDGPYNQAAQNKWKSQKYMKEVLGMEDFCSRCKMLHAVWFPAIKKSRFRGVVLPPEADLRITLTQEAEDNIEKAISDIFDYDIPNQCRTNLTYKDTDMLMRKFFAPQFNLVSIPAMKHDHNEQVFKAMLREQVALLNYLEEQDNAVINGMAGTGKTVMAITKAMRHADRGEKVLFLCYNVKLKEHLQEVYAHDYISFYTIDGLACRLCNTPKPNYDALAEALTDPDVPFSFQHIIIDEGQDFQRADEKDIITYLKMKILDDEQKHGTFYLFYDRNQMVQAEDVPEYVKEADCRLTLYRNSRNSFNIATTSLRLLGSSKQPKRADGVLVGDSPELFLAADVEMTVKTLNWIIEDLWKNDYKNIQILTCMTEQSSIIARECSGGQYLYNKRRIPFTTCRKFKGLEADAIIMVDIIDEMISEEGDQLLYVGSSRAKFKLSMIAHMDDTQCKALVERLGLRQNRRPGKALAPALNAKFCALQL